MRTPRPSPSVVPVPRRKHLRMQGWDFTSPGWYFVTICTKDMKSVFGHVVGGRMLLNPAGTIADRCWRDIPAHFPHVETVEHMVMPNHVHGLLHIPHAPAPCRGGMEAFGKPVAGSIPTVVRSYKAAVSRALGTGVWQGRFYEVRARDDAARANIRRYIRENPRNDDAVRNGGIPRVMGNRALLDMPTVGFLASRGAPQPHGRLPIRPGEAILSGFLSPMERAVFNAGLRHKVPMIWVQSWGLNSPTACCGAIDTPCRGAIDAGRLLLLSPFDPALDAPNERRAAWCNHYVVEHADRLVVGHLNPAGMPACILSEANPAKEATYMSGGGVS